jgi:hypothetical protein
MNDWKLRTGYKGLQSWVWRDEWQVCVREDITSRSPRFRVIRSGLEVATRPTLKAAQTEALRHLIELAQEQEGE